MNATAIRTVILWIHAIGGAAWIGACVCFLLAAGAMGLDNDEGHGFARRVAPSINRIGLAAMLLIVVTGLVNIFLAGSERGYHFSSVFVAVLCAKIAILIVMFLLLIASLRAEVDLDSPDPAALTRTLWRMLYFDGAIAAVGALAMILGLWLLGS